MTSDASICRHPPAAHHHRRSRCQHRELGYSLRHGATGPESRVSMAHGHKVEVLNRKMMILAGYRAMIEQGKSPKEALATALEINSAVNIDMGRYNLPGFAAKRAAGRTVYALQSFIQHALAGAGFYRILGDSMALSLAFLIGGIFGIALMCLLQINRGDD